MNTFILTIRVHFFKYRFWIHLGKVSSNSQELTCRDPIISVQIVSVPLTRQISSLKIKGKVLGSLRGRNDGMHCTAL